VSLDAAARRVKSTADWKHEVVAVGVGVAELPVAAGVARVPAALERQRYRTRVIAHRGLHYVLRGVGYRPGVPRSGPAASRKENAVSSTLRPG